MCTSTCLVVLRLTNYFVGRCDGGEDDNEDGAIVNGTIVGYYLEASVHGEGDRGEGSIIHTMRVGTEKASPLVFAARRGYIRVVMDIFCLDSLS